MPSNSDINLESMVPRLLIHIEGIIEMLEGKIAKRISNYKPRAIWDTGEFLNKLTHSVERHGDAIVCKIWSDAPHAMFVLGGKVPSWTPIKPLKAWVERKKLGWIKPKDNTPEAIDRANLSMAYAIQRKIKREGIAERNVFAEVTREEWAWLQEKIADFNA